MLKTLHLHTTGSVTWVRCWRPPVTGRQVTVFLLRSLCPCRESYNTTVHRWCWAPTRVCSVTAPFHSLHQWFSTFSLMGAKSRPTILLDFSFTKIL